MPGVDPGDARSGHVTVSDRFDFFRPVGFGHRIETAEDGVEHLDHFPWFELGGEPREIHYVDENDACLREAFCDGLFPFLQALGDPRGQDIEQQLIGSGFREDRITVDHARHQSHEAKNDRTEKPIDHESQFGSHGETSRKADEARKKSENQHAGKTGQQSAREVDAFAGSKENQADHHETRDRHPTVGGVVSVEVEKPGSD